MPDNVVIPFIEGVGIGADIWAAASMVFDSAVEKAYNGLKSIQWLEVLAGENPLMKTESGFLKKLLIQF